MECQKGGAGALGDAMGVAGVDEKWLERDEQWELVLGQCGVAELWLEREGKRVEE